MTDSEKSRFRVLLVDDHPIVRQGLMLLINAEPDLTVCGEASTAAEAIRMVAQTAPDIAMIDISLEDRSGVELIKDLRAQSPVLPMLALSMHDESLYAERVLRAGGRGYVMKQEATENMLTAIRRVLSGEIYLSPRMSTQLLNQFAATPTGQNVSPLSRLTDREMEVFTMIGRGLSTREIADKLFLSVKTVEAHREHIKEKLSLRSATELIRHAVRFDLAPDA